MLCSFFLAIVLCLFNHVIARNDNNKKPPLTYNETHFLYDDKPIQLLGGQMDPHRVPYEHWRDRIKMARAMGLNTLFAYIYWDQLEPQEGEFDFNKINNIKEYFKIAQEEGLYGGLRMGPFVCAEHEWGGYPYWLANKQNMQVRTNDKEMREATHKFFKAVHDNVKEQLATNGGNIILVQVENEYGAYGDDMDYKIGLRDMAIDVGFDVPLYTTDMTGKETIEKGNIPNVLAEVDGHNGTENPDRLKYIPDNSTNGPFMNAEYYTTWIDHWNDTKHNENDDKGIDKVQKDLLRLLNSGGSFSLYMFHGGTNWGFQSGSNYEDGSIRSTTTSYDYGAPLDESGRPNQLYYGIRNTLQKYLRTNGTYMNDTDIPDIPHKENRISIDEFTVKKCSNLLQKLSSASGNDGGIKKTHSKKPRNMEQIGQATGFINYRTTLNKDLDNNTTLTVGDKPRDRVLIYINGERKGLIDSRINERDRKPIILHNLKKNDQLDLLVENVGRVNFMEQIVDQRKGIVGDVTIGSDTIEDWDIYPLPLTGDDVRKFTENCDDGGGDYSDQSKYSPTFFTGKFELDHIEDTFLSYKGWAKGVIWVNGHNLGRYWKIGPQQQLYLPKAYLKKGQNSLVILELLKTDTNKLEGVQTRTWYNEEDPDMELNG